MLSEPILVTLKVAAAFERLSIPYSIGGSLASAVHGTVRATIDADLIADIQPSHISSLITTLEDEFYAEDIILAKLEWFRAGGETSERQWAERLGIQDLLQRVMQATPREEEDA
jgi:hypothetical protein